MFVGDVANVSGVYAVSIFKIFSWKVSVYTWNSVLKSDGGGRETDWSPIRTNRGSESRNCAD
jgi:hypothetical protein